MVSKSLPCKRDFGTQHSRKNHLDVLGKAVVAIVVAIQSYLIRIYHGVIILRGNLLHRARVTFRLTLCHILADHLVFKAVF